MNIEFGASNRGRPTLTYQDYEHVKKQETNTTTHWICRQYCQIKCPSSVMTSGSEIIKSQKIISATLGQEQRKRDKPKTN